MKISIQYIIIFFYFSICNVSSLKATKILQLKKTEGGEVICCRKNIPLTHYPVTLTLIIGNENNSLECEFPWIIKAFVGDTFGYRERLVGESDEIRLDDFNINLAAGSNLISTDVDLTVDLSLRSKNLNVVQCEEDYFTEFITYRIFSAEQEVNTDCPLLNKAELENGSEFLLDSIKICLVEFRESYKISNEDSRTNERLHSSPSMSMFKLLSDHEDGIVSNELPRINIFPNPAYNSINIDFINNLLGTVAIEIYSIAGKQLVRRYIHDPKGLVKLNTESLDPGMYFIKVHMNNLSYARKIHIIN